MKFEEGQEVLRCSGGAFGTYSLKVVKKITPKGFVRVGTELYDNSKDGKSYAKGSYSWGTPSITNDKKEIENFKKYIFIKNLKRKIENTTISYEQALKINEILNGD